jgi:hypothetical protein
MEAHSGMCMLSFNNLIAAHAHLVIGLISVVKFFSQFTSTCT